MARKRDLLSITDFSPDETLKIIKRASRAKGEDWGQPLQGKALALLFQKPSLRTRVSFEVGIKQLGGHPIYLGPQEGALGGREPVSDVARVLSGYVDCVIARVSSHDLLTELAQHASIPVVNALTDLEHPCQIMADLLTIYENKGTLEGLKLAFVGDGNNVARSLCLALPAVGMNFAIASPEGYNLDKATIKAALAQAAGNGAKIVSVKEPAEAVRGADIVYTDVWTSMGQETEAQARRRDFQGYTVDAALMAQARPGALFMHDMPAHYGEEVPPGMLEHPQSVAYQQAHNRLHAQKGILEFVLSQD